MGVVALGARDLRLVRALPRGVSSHDVEDGALLREVGDASLDSGDDLVDVGAGAALEDCAPAGGSGIADQAIRALRYTCLCVLEINDRNGDTMRAVLCKCTYHWTEQHGRDGVKMGDALDRKVR